MGLTPEDWDVVTLGNVATIHDGTHQTPRYVPFGVPFYSVEHVTSRDFSNTRFISRQEHRYLTRSFKIEKGDILMTRIGSIGDCVLVDWDVEASFYVSLALLKVHGAYAPYVAAYSESPQFQKEVEANSLPSATPKKINLGAISRIRLALPFDLEEQKSIARAWQDIDALLDELDRLIAKKQVIKQAAMQQLLTGEARLPGFDDEWETKCLADIVDIRGGGTPSTANPHFWNGDVAWCTPTDITALRGGKYLIETERKISLAGLEASSAEIVPPHSIIMTTRATIGACAINVVPMATNQGFQNLVPLAVDPEFLYYLMTTQTKRLTQLSGGSTFLEIRKRQLQMLEIYLPSDLAEQQAIAAVLSDMDAEIEALEQRRAKTAELKQAMMQELLTGKTRLVKPQSSLQEVAHG